MKVREIFFFSFFLFPLICSPVLSQQNPTRSQQAQQQSQIENRLQTSAYLTGSVVFEDGMPMTDMGPVELVCGGKVQRQVNLSGSGRFALDVSNKDRTTPMMDASVSGPTGFGRTSNMQRGSLDDGTGFGSAPQGLMDLSGCEVRLSPRAGYLSSSILLGQRSIFEASDIGVIVVRRLDAKGGTTVSLTTLAAPEKAQKSYAKARVELSKEQPNLKKAKEELEKATKAYPEYAEAWNLLGQTGIKMRDEDLARSSFAKSFAADPKFTPPYFELIYLELQGSRFAEAAQLSNALLDLLPNAPRAQYFHGLAHYKQGDLAVAEVSFREIEKSGNWQEYTMAFFYLAMIDAKQGQIPLAAQEFRTYLRVTPEQLFPEGLKDQIVKQLQTWESGGLIEEETPLPKIQD